MGQKMSISVFVINCKTNLIGRPFLPFTKQTIVSKVLRNEGLQKSVRKRGNAGTRMCTVSFFHNNF